MLPRIRAILVPKLQLSSLSVIVRVTEGVRSKPVVSMTVLLEITGRFLHYV